MSAAAQQIIAVPELRASRNYWTVCMIAVDALALQLSLLLGCLFRYAWRTNALARVHLEFAELSQMSVALAGLVVVYYCVGLYPGYGVSGVQRLRTRVRATALVFAFLFGWSITHQAALAPTGGILLVTFFFALIMPPVFESFARRFMFKGRIEGEATVVLGASGIAESITKKLQAEPDFGLSAVAILDDDPGTWGTFINGIPVLGPISSAAISRCQARVAIIAMPEMQKEGLASFIECLSVPRIIVLPDLPALQTLWLTSRDLGGVLGLEISNRLLVSRNLAIKRSLDYAIAVPAAIITLPIIFAFAAWIKRVSPGSAFFRQEREGRNGKTIKVWKLRTMYPNSDALLKLYLDEKPEEKDKWVRYYKLKNDPRILPGIGTFLRASSFDELPQLWNVLIGDMSLVGPRPFPDYHLQSFTTQFRTLRRSVPPGLTGLWQISERSNGDLAVQETHDTYYIRNWSLWLDLYILIRTIWAILTPTGAY